MKTINKYITEKLKISKPKKVKHTLFPIDFDELSRIIKSEIQLNGENCDLNHIDISNIDDLSCLFAHTNTFDNINGYGLMNFNGDISNWDVSNVINMHALFYESDFNGDISNWDVSKVKNMEWMFANSFFNGDISEWDVSNVKNMYSMFRHSEFNQNISKWKIKPNCATKFMFLECGIRQSYKPKESNKII